MTGSKELAGLIGPTIVALAVTEAMNFEIFASQIAPVVYLSGAILFVAGLAIVRAHNRWTWRWPVIITLVGWAAVFGGLWRMAVPEAPQAGANTATHALLAAIGAVGALLSAVAYGSWWSTARRPSDG
jgi:hypothetical protein